MRFQPWLHPFAFINKEYYESRILICDSGMRFGLIFLKKIEN
jgi:hypothetical protein